MLLLVVHMLGGGRLHEVINVNAWLQKSTKLYLLLSPALGPAVLTMLPEKINYASLKSSSYSTRIMKNDEIKKCARLPDESLELLLADLGFRSED